MILHFKQFSLTLLCSLCFSLNVLGQRPSPFFEKVSGTYIDTKTYETVYLYNAYVQLGIFYQANPYNPANQIKGMETIKIDESTRTLKAKFLKSNYQCLFKFSTDFQKFTCKNPNGSIQNFQRVDNPIYKPFSFFISQFTRHSSAQYNISANFKAPQMIPPEIALRYLVKKGIPGNVSLKPTEYSFKGIAEGYLRQGLYASTPPAYHILKYDPQPSMWAFYYIKQLPISDRFSTLILQFRGSSHSEVHMNWTFLANFTPTGKMIDVVPLAYNISGLGGQTVANGAVKAHKIYIKSKKMQVTYQPSGRHKTTLISAKNYHYEIMSTGKMKIKLD